MTKETENSKSAKIHFESVSTIELLVITLLFVICAVAFTCPMVTDLQNKAIYTIRANDIHFNIWVIFWGAHALTTDPLNLHHANMFHPEPYTFAYSDIELSHSVLMLPVIALFNHPEMTYAILCLFSLILGGVGFYLLGKDLVGNKFAAFGAAILFLYGPAHIGRIFQIQFFGDFWMPWFVWALLRWLRIRAEQTSASKQGYFWIGFSVLFYVLHVLSGSHNAIYGTVFAAFIVLFFLFKDRLWAKKLFWADVAVMAIVSALVLVPVLYPYFLIEKEMAVQRVPDIEALRVSSAGGYELLSAGSHFYRWLRFEHGWPSAFFQESRPYTLLFPGLILPLMAFLGFITFRKDKGADVAPARFFAWLLDLLMLVTLWMAVIITLTGTDILQFFIFPFAAPPGWLLVIVALVLLVTRLLLFSETRHLLHELFVFVSTRLSATYMQLVLLFIFVFSFWASLGPDFFLYSVLSKLPLVKLIRVPSRFMLLGIFILGLLALYGLKKLAVHIKGGEKKLLVWLIIASLFFVVESSYAPFKLYPVYEFPELYKWLGTQRGEYAIIELPVDPRGWAQSIRQVYGSIYHWKKLLVGYSGYQTEENVELLTRINEGFPGKSALDELESLNVRFVIVFENRLDENKVAQLHGEKRLREVKRYGKLVVYEFISWQK